jgi:hypothetical protein
MVGLRQAARRPAGRLAADGTLVAATPPSIIGPMTAQPGAGGWGLDRRGDHRFDGQLMIAAAAPIVAGSEIIGAVLAADTIDERYAQRVASTDLVVVVTVENG